MSAEAVGYVYRYSAYTGATFQVHHAIADSVNDQNDNELWMATGTIAKKARVARQTASEAIATIVANGGLEVVEDHRHDRAGKPSRYRFLFPDLPVVYSSRGVTTDDTSQRGVSPTATRGVVSDDEGVTTDDTNPSNPREPKKDGAEARPPAKKRGSQLPDSWAPKESHRALAAKHGVQDIDHEVEQFRNHHQARGSVMVNWDAAFRTWLGNTRRFSGRHLQVVNGRPYGAPDDAVLIDGVWIR